MSAAAYLRVVVRPGLGAHAWYKWFVMGCMLPPPPAWTAQGAVLTFSAALYIHPTAPSRGCCGQVWEAGGLSQRLREAAHDLLEAVEIQRLGAIG